MQVNPGIYQITSPLGPRHVHQYLLVGEKKILVDAGIPSTPKAAILPALDQLGIGVGELDAIVVSHGDVDHFGGVAALREAGFVGETAAHEADARWLENVETVKAERYFAYESMGIFHDPETKAWFDDNLVNAPVDRALKGGERWDLGGGRTVEILRLPGHTDGHIGVWDEATRTAIVIDAVLGEGLYDLQGNLISPPPYYDVDAYLTSIDRLRSLPIETMLTGHYEPLRGQEVADFLDLSARFVKRLEQAVREAFEAQAQWRLPDLFERCNAQTGRFTVMAVELVGPVLAHLAKMEREGLVAGDGKGLWAREASA